MNFFIVFQEKEKEIKTKVNQPSNQQKNWSDTIKPPQTKKKPHMKNSHKPLITFNKEKREGKKAFTLKEQQ